MPEIAADSKLFEEVVRPLLERGVSVRFQARGGSMSPAIRDGEIVEVTPVIVTKLRKDDIVLAKSNAGFRLHRIVRADPANDLFITRGDCGLQNDPGLTGCQILGLAHSKEVRLGRKIVQARFRGVGGSLLRAAARAQYLSRRLLAAAANSPFIAIAICILLMLATVRAQVAVDSTSSATATLAGAGTPTLTIAHTTAGANRLMLVGVSMNVTNAAATAVTGVTWNGTALNFVGAHNDAGNTRRVEMWSLLAPAAGTFNVVVSVDIPSAVSIGVVAGVTTFTGVDQTVPLGTFVSADGAAGANSQLDVPSVVNGMILDTLATDGTQTVAVPGPQVQQWNRRSGGTTNPGIRGVGSSRTGAPSVPISETFSGTSNWSLGAVSMNPSTADIGVSTSVSAVPLGQNSTFNITIRNNGPSAANNVTLADTYNATNLSLVSYTPSAGTTCTNTATTINCTLPTPFASGATATVAVVVSTTQAGFYPNTATVTDSGTPPDPNTGNNTYVALAPVVSVVCGTNNIGPAPSALTGVINTYFPGTASVAKGATSIPIGTGTGAGGTIANGSLLLVIQMQDASINTSDTVAYGNGSTGQGFTAINNAGNYEFVTATGPVAGGSVPVTAAGGSGGLVFGYTAAAASATKGASTYQVVLVPQYTAASLGAATALAWNGSTGGVLALDIAGQLNLNGATVSVDGLGFRGGAGMQLIGGVGGANTDYWFTSPATYTGAVGGAAGVDSSKGEGVAGTPMWVESGGTFLQTTTGVGYPSGTVGTDGSMARGAPGNAGGGSTDGDPPNNDENNGGGGGANGGSGGFGGNSWRSNLSNGGEGGGAFPATIDRIAMGGGGGAGTRNNSDGDNQASSGSAGGGIIFIRADSLTGSATLTANGAAAYNGTANDAGGGGGAGGTIVVLSAHGGEGGLTLQANGGRGGNAWQSQAYSLANRHGPGGGGSGGAVFISGAPAGVSVAGGGSGLTLNPGVPYGATPGNAGITATNATLGQVTGIQSSALCVPDLTLSKSHVGNFTRGSVASYTIPVSNVSPYGATTGLVTMNDTLPFGISPTSATGTGWTCSISGQTVSCTRSDALPAGATYNSAITINALVSQSAPATLTNIATIGGGGEANLLNDTATDTANVVSSAEMAVTDSGSPNPVATNGSITYTVVVTNNGPSAGDNATLVLPIPNSTVFSSLTPPAGWSCQVPGVGGTGNVICTNASMAGLSSATFTLVVKVANGTTNGTVITATATVSSSVIDPIQANNTAVVTTIVGTSGPNLSVTNVASPNPVQAGNNITYTQVVTNTGSSAITNGTFTEATPANTAFVSITPPAGWTCTSFPASPCTSATVAAGTSGTFTVVYTVAAGTTAGTVITDTATVNAANQSFGANSATATDVVATAAQADVSLSTVATPSTVYAGNSITYTQTVTNNGPASATGVAFTEATPTNTTFQSVLAPAGWTCTTPAVGATGTINCSDSSALGNGSSTDIVVVLNVPSTVATGTITTTSSVAATTSDPNAANNTTTLTTSVNVRCDVSVTNSGAPSPVAAGSNITYTQVINNSGPSNCSTGTLSEPTPNNSSFVSVAVVNSGGATWSCPNSAPVACSAATVPPGSSATVTAVYMVTAGTAGGTIIADTVTVATTSRDTNPNNNSATVNIPVASGAQADLSVTNSGSPNPVTAGNNITYTQSVTNAGQASANAPVLSETLPAGTTAVSLTTSAGWTCVLATLNCTAPAAMAANTTANFAFVVTVPSTVANGTVLSQTASVTSTTGDPNLNNNSASVSTVVADTADLSVTNTPAPVPVQANNTITYTQVVINAGPSTATSVTLTENLPANTTAQTLTGPAGWTCTVGTLTCSNPSFGPGSATITYTVLVNAGTSHGTAISETASVSSSTADPNTSNNSATAADIVAAVGDADLIVTNSPTPTSVAAGSNVTYTQTVTNKGPAVATGASFTQPTPPNTNFQLITPPAGWTCGTQPAVGGTGTITCNATGSLAVNSSGTFTLVLQVNSGTPSGTNITDTATATATNIVPNLTTNTASATVVVANANSADMAVVKTASPNPVTQGTPLTYSLTVTNNGPASATNVTVTDTLPSTVTYLFSSSTVGSCSEAGGTVTCLLGTMTNAATATITILTIPGQAGTISNTATVTADQTDPVPANNTSTQNEIVVAPTKITLRSFSAHYGTDKNGANRAVLIWRTGGESHNLGFNVYRELNGNRVRMNPSIIAGSALIMSGALSRHAAKSYAWFDPSAPDPVATYWLEDVDVNGTRTMHGPVSAVESKVGSEATPAESRTLSQMNQAQPPAAGSQDSHILESDASTDSPASWQVEKQFELASRPAIKIDVRHEGWYRVGQADLVKAGLDPNVDPATLRLYSEAIEQPIQITGATAGSGGFGPQAAINFYGTGINTVFSGTRVYWLVSGEKRGARIRHLPVSTGSNQPPADYRATVELRQHSIYFSALITSTGENFFGALVSPAPVDQVLGTPYLDTASSEPAGLEISLQGIIRLPHDVAVSVNGTNLGDVTFIGQVQGKAIFDIPAGVLRPGSNTVTLAAQNGDYDTSLVDYVRIIYPHLYIADSDQLKFTGRAGDEITVSNFSSVPVVLDITDPNRPVQLTPQVTSQDGKYQIAVQVPFTTSNPHATVRHRLLAVTGASFSSPSGVMPNHPSHWHSHQPGADIAIVTYGDFAGALAPIIHAHRGDGKSSAVVRVADLYDEFNFGEHSPFAIKRFLQSALKNWRKPPAYLLLNGRASLDPRNYLGFGDLDLIPTRIIPSASLMTASDDWFSDFKENGLPTIATGRLPVSTIAEAQTMAGKIAAYEGKSTDGPWTSNALFVADKDDDESFTQDSQTVQAELPATMQISDVFVNNVGVAAARGDIVSAINSGQVIVNYLGHGSEEQWAGPNIFDGSAVSSLTNGSQLPVFLIMDCLNGLFQDVYGEPLGVSLVLAPNGGAVAALASSGLNQPSPQTQIDGMVIQNAFTRDGMTLGDAIVKAKANITDLDVRRTFILFGDPAMKVKQPTGGAATH